MNKKCGNVNDKKVKAELKFLEGKSKNVKMQESKVPKSTQRK